MTVHVTDCVIFQVGKRSGDKNVARVPRGGHATSATMRSELSSSDEATMMIWWLSLSVEDDFPAGKRWWFRLHEQGGKRHEVPTHHNAEAYVDEYQRRLGALWTLVEPSEELTRLR